MTWKWEVRFWNIVQHRVSVANLTDETHDKIYLVYEGVLISPGPYLQMALAYKIVYQYFIEVLTVTDIFTKMDDFENTFSKNTSNLKVLSFLK